MGYNYCLDFPQKNQSVNNVFLYIQGWIASDEQIDEIFLYNNDIKTEVKIYPRPDVEKAFPKRFVVGFKYLYSPEEILNLSINLEIHFLTGKEKGKIHIDQDVINSAKMAAKEIIKPIKSAKMEKLEKIRHYLVCPLCLNEVATVCNGLSGDALECFKNIRVGDLLNPGETYLNRPFTMNLNQETQKIIASVSFLIAQKPHE